MIKQYLRNLWRGFFNVLVALDCFGNAILLGDPEETISSRCGKRRRVCTVCRWVCRMLHWVDADHCDRYIMPEQGGDAIRP